MLPARHGGFGAGATKVSSDGYICVGYIAEINLS